MIFEIRVFEWKGEGDWKAGRSEGQEEQKEEVEMHEGRGDMV